MTAKNIATLPQARRRPPAPQHLDPERRALWDAVVAKYDFAGDALALRTLEELMAAYMRLAEIKAHIAATGLLITTGEGNQKGNPLLAAETQVQRTILALIKALGIKLDEDDGSHTTPRR